MNSLVKIGAALFALFIAFSMFSQCSRRESARVEQASPPPQPVATEVILKEFSKGLDLKAVSELAKNSKDAEDFERKLNSSAEGVNNIDLDDDGKVDYINITEYGSGDKRGFSLTTEIAPGEKQEIATIEFNRDPGGTTAVQTTGNPSLYGPGNYHHSSFGVTDALLMAWMFSSRPSYASPFGWGNYPPQYGGGYDRRNDGDYARGMNSRTAGSTFASSKRPVISQPLPSPNAEKIAAKARAIADPSKSQRSFATRTGGGAASSGGFGRNSTSGSSGSSSSTSTPSRYGGSPSTSSSSSTRSSGGFGRTSSSGSSRSGSFGGGGK